MQQCCKSLDSSIHGLVLGHLHVHSKVKRMCGTENLKFPLLLPLPPMAGL